MQLKKTFSFGLIILMGQTSPSTWQLRKVGNLLCKKVNDCRTRPLMNATKPSGYPKRMAEKLTLKTTDDFL